MPSRVMFIYILMLSPIMFVFTLTCHHLPCLCLPCHAITYHICLPCHAIICHVYVYPCHAIACHVCLPYCAMMSYLFTLPCHHLSCLCLPCHVTTCHVYIVIPSLVTFVFAISGHVSWWYCHAIMWSVVYIVILLHVMFVFTIIFPQL